MKIFFGAAIQGIERRGERSETYLALLETMKKLGHSVVTEHTAGDNTAEVARRLEESIGPLPPVGPQRISYVRDKMIEAVESDIAAAIFEVSTPSLGTGVEIAHAYLRPRMGIPAIPILALYEKNYWPNNLSTMIRGITIGKVPCFTVKEYESLPQAQEFIGVFLKGISSKV